MTISNSCFVLCDFFRVQEHSCVNKPRPHSTHSTFNTPTVIFVIISMWKCVFLCAGNVHVWNLTVFQAGVINWMWLTVIYCDGGKEGLARLILRQLLMRVKDNLEWELVVGTALKEFTGDNAQYFISHVRIPFCVSAVQTTKKWHWNYKKCCWSS